MLTEVTRFPNSVTRKANLYCQEGLFGIWHCYVVSIDKRHVYTARGVSREDAIAKARKWVATSVSAAARSLVQ